MQESDRLESAGHLMGWAARLSARLIDRELKELGVVSAYLPIFFSLADGRCLSPTALAKVAAIEQPTMTMTLSRMERDGLVERQPNLDDARSTLFSLSPAAMEKAVAVGQVTRRVNGDILSILPEAERPAYLNMLRSIIGRLTELQAG